MTEPQSTSSFGYSAAANRTHRQPISEMMVLALQNPSLVSLAAGLVDYDSLPTQAVRTLADSILSDTDHARAALQYGTTEGYKSLRHELLEHFCRLDETDHAGLGADIDNIVVTSGSQELLYLITQTLIDPGDIVITGYPSYFVYTGTLASAGATVRCCEMDENGVIPESLDALMTELAAAGEIDRLKAIYLVTYHQNPSSITLAEERKPQILEIIEAHQPAVPHKILLMEDAAYRELSYDASAPFSFRKFDTTDRVAMLQTFSKPLAPGLKLGYGLLPKDLAEQVILQKGNIDFGTCNLAQHITAEALASGIYAKHVAKVRAAYGEKCQVMLDALDAELGEFRPDETTWTRPDGGMYVWLTLPEDIDTGPDSVLCAAALKHGMIYVPGEFCFPNDPGRVKPKSKIRLTFGLASKEQIREGIRRLAVAIKEVNG
ncbi:MAG: PLP-dependent aminotransferase family protein [Phycisphaerales bacterium]|jgi:2-aminoadipate transaminase|nr:PLP-dependent aminotransferase family protein [Phycisphaerales bacterium]MBT7170209.1 PLP-dependent aminotransferase family protein [Phycisphaerales bacterium]